MHYGVTHFHILQHRVISDHGREARLPFLDEDVVALLNTVPMHIKVRIFKTFAVYASSHLGGHATSTRRGREESASQQCLFFYY